MVRAVFTYANVDSATAQAKEAAVSYFKIVFSALGRKLKEGVETAGNRHFKSMGTGPRSMEQDLS